jgi:hypothetical protein
LSGRVGQQEHLNRGHAGSLQRLALFAKRLERAGLPALSRGKGLRARKKREQALIFPAKCHGRYPQPPTFVAKRLERAGFAGAFEGEGRPAGEKAGA